MFFITIILIEGIKVVPWSFAWLLWNRLMPQCNWRSHCTNVAVGRSMKLKKPTLFLSTVYPAEFWWDLRCNGSADILGALQRLSPASFRYSHGESSWSLKAQTAATAESLLCLIASFCTAMSGLCFCIEDHNKCDGIFMHFFKDTCKWKISPVCQLENLKKDFLFETE